MEEIKAIEKLSIVIGILVVGFFFWLIGFAPVENTFKKIAKGVVLFIGILWLIITLLQIFRV